MPWVETESLSFVARHESSQATAAERVLGDLETFRAEVEPAFGRVPAPVSIVIHPRPALLALSQPWLPLARAVSAPAGRRYIAGWFAWRELHVLAPEALERRAARAPGSRAALLLSPRHEYAHLLVGAVNESLPPPFSPPTFRRYVRMAWLCEGAATHLAGQVPHLRAAIARRMREGPRPAFPPSARDAWVLGGTVFAMLESERGLEACIDLASAPEHASADKAIERAFGRPVASVERGWTDYLAGLMTR